jgi:hypothetical protein
MTYRVGSAVGGKHTCACATKPTCAAVGCLAMVAWGEVAAAKLGEGEQGVLHGVCPVLLTGAMS